MSHIHHARRAGATNVALSSVRIQGASEFIRVAKTISKMLNVFRDVAAENLIRGLEIETESLGQLQDRDPIIISGRDQLRNLIGQLDFRLKDVETRHGPGECVVRKMNN